MNGRRTRIKALLLDQSFLRGMGNIYTDESLWRARVHPMRLAASLKEDEIARLYRAVRQVLEEAIRLRGSSVSDYVDSNGVEGEFQLRHRVYQRHGRNVFAAALKSGDLLLRDAAATFVRAASARPEQNLHRATALSTHAINNARAGEA